MLKTAWSIYRPTRQICMQGCCTWPTHTHTCCLVYWSTTATLSPIKAQSCSHMCTYYIVYDPNPTHGVPARVKSSFMAPINTRQIACMFGWHRALGRRTYHASVTMVFIARRNDWLTERPPRSRHDGVTICAWRTTHGPHSVDLEVEPVGRGQLLASLSSHNQPNKHRHLRNYVCLELQPASRVRHRRELTHTHTHTDTSVGLRNPASNSEIQCNFSSGSSTMVWLLASWSNCGTS